MSAALQQYERLLDELFRKRAVGPLGDDEEERLAEDLDDCRREMTRDEEEEIPEIVARLQDAHAKAVPKKDQRNCGTCRHWSASEARVTEDTPGISSHHRCIRILHGNGSRPHVEGEPALIHDGSGYAATLWTLPTFGCALFETAVRKP